LYECNSEEAFAGLEWAIALNPDYASAWHFYGFLLFGRGRFERALQALQHAHLLDPLSSIIHVQLASFHYVTRNFKQATTICEEVLRLDPNFWPERWFCGLALEQLGRSAEAYRNLVTAVDMSNRSPMPRAALGHLTGTCGKRDYATAIANELEQRRAENHAGDCNRACSSRMWRPASST
jgi:Flp pilus assembly protein TadD